MIRRHASVKISLDDLLGLWCQNSNSISSTKSMKKVLDGLLKTILQELKLNGEIYIYNFGTFYLTQIGGGTKILNNIKTGELERKFLKPKLQLRFKPSMVMNNAINRDDFELIPRKTNRKYRNFKEYIHVKNIRRRKPKPTIEQLANNLLNQSESRLRKNGKA